MMVKIKGLDKHREEMGDEELKNTLLHIERSRCLGERDCNISLYNLAGIIQEIMECREADKPLDIKDQLRLVRDKCPDVWDMVFENYLCGICPSEYGIRCEEDDSTEGTDCSGYSSQCKTCWNKGIEG